MKPAENWNEQLYCRMVKFYGRIFNLPPLASKIYSYLLFDFERTGKTFDELVDIFSVSKSSVSTNLNLLLQNKLIKDLSKLDERKRYFVINHDMYKVRMQEIAEFLNEELFIIEGFEKMNKKPMVKELDKYESYKDLLRKNIENIEEFLGRL